MNHLKCARLILGVWLPAGWCCIGLCLGGQALPPEEKASASELLRPPGISGGLCVHLGCGDGKQTVALARSGRFLVHALDADFNNLKETIKRVESKGLLGRVSVEYWDAARLPYAGNVVNQLVASAPGKVSVQEMLRALRPLGIVYIKRGDKWAKITKPWPKGMDEWTHPRHGADGNPASNDTEPGVPYGVRWIAHEGYQSRRFGPGSAILLTARGRNFYENGMVLDSFNGLPLWSRPMRSVHVAVDDRLYAVVGSSLTALDAATGETVASFNKDVLPGGHLRHVRCLHTDGLIIMACKNAVEAYDAKSGGGRWSYPASGPRGLVAGDGKIFFAEDNAVVCLDTTGKKLWSQSNQAWAKGVIYCAYRDGILAYTVKLEPEKSFTKQAVVAVSAKDGTRLWQFDCVPGSGYFGSGRGGIARGIFAGDAVWVLTRHQRLKALDPLTGKVIKTIFGQVGRCWPPVATQRYLICADLNFHDLRTTRAGNADTNKISRAYCTLGLVPANGLLYTFGSGAYCDCFPYLDGIMAICSRSKNGSARASIPRVERGPAAGVPLPRAAEAEEHRGEEWRHYRHDGWRSGASATVVSPALRPMWATAMSPGTGASRGLKKGETSRPPARNRRGLSLPPAGLMEASDSITPPTIAAGLLFVAVTDKHQVKALNASNGKPFWSHTANGRIDLPPTIYEGRCIFGTRSGWVYCLSAAHGELIWRFGLGPEDRRIVVYHQMESAWPVPGSVVVEDGVVYCAGGRSPLADDGIHLYALNVDSGRMRWEQRIQKISSWQASRFRYNGGRQNLTIPDYELMDIVFRDRGDRIGVGGWRFNIADGTPASAGDGGRYDARSTGISMPVGGWAYSHKPPALRAHGRYPPLAVCNDTTRCTSGKDGVSLSGQRNWSVREGGAARAMVLTADTLFVCDRSGKTILSFSAADGRKLSEYALGTPVRWDGMAAAYGRLYVSTEDGKVVCLGGRSKVKIPSPPKVKRATARKPPTPAEKTKTTGGQEPASGDGSSARWDAGLRERLRAGLKAGRKIFLGTHRQRFALVSVDDQGDMKVETRLMQLTLRWETLKLTDRKNLAESLAGGAGTTAEDYRLAAYYLLRLGKRIEADAYLQKLSPDDAKAVREAVP